MGSQCQVYINCILFVVERTAGSAVMPVTIPYLYIQIKLRTYHREKSFRENYKRENNSSARNLLAFVTSVFSRKEVEKLMTS